MSFWCANETSIKHVPGVGWGLFEKINGKDELIAVWPDLQSVWRSLDKNFELVNKEEEQ